jgi:hypothetical protein
VFALGECADPGYGTGQLQGPPSYQAVTNNSYPAPVHKAYQPHCQLNAESANAEF